jgi:hypothetical protein
MTLRALPRVLAAGGGLSLLLVVAASCNGLGGLGVAACPQLRNDVDALGASFSANASVNGKVRTFVQAAKDIAEVAARAEMTAASACLRMGADLGLTPQQMGAREGQGGAAKGACEAVATRIGAMQQQGIYLRVQVTPPQCQADVQAEARCNGSCSAQLDPGYVVANCDPGRLSGQCQGTCAGRCDGRCNGQCNGNCAARDAAGNCFGQCQGECRGQCDATCHARCEGQWQAPQCEGMVVPPSADAQCQASCHAHADVRAQCTPAEVQIQVSQNTQATAALAATLQANLPQLLFAQIALGQRLIGDINTVVRIGQDMPQIVGAAGAQALACIAAATDATISASVRVEVTVQASASVSGRVGG